MSTELDALRAAVLAAFPGLAEPRLVQYRVVGPVAGRLSLQKVSELDGAPDALPVEVWPGVPGVTSIPAPGELVIVAFVGIDQCPAVISRAPSGGAGHPPLEVRLDAETEIRALGAVASDAAVMRVGASPTFPLARAVDLQSLLSAIQGAAITLSGLPDPHAAAVGAALDSALSGVTVTPTTRLEAA